VRQIETEALRKLAAEMDDPAAHETILF
jgi:hypothetical protein